MANNTTGLTRIIKAAGYSWKGFRAAWVNEAAFRQEGVAAIIAVFIIVPLIFLAKVTKEKKA